MSIAPLIMCSIFNQVKIFKQRHIKQSKNVICWFVEALYGSFTQNLLKTEKKCNFLFVLMSLYLLCACNLQKKEQKELKQSWARWSACFRGQPITNVRFSYLTFTLPFSYFYQLRHISIQLKYQGFLNHPYMFVLQELPWREGSTLLSVVGLVHVSVDSCLSHWYHSLLVWPGVLQHKSSYVSTHVSNLTFNDQDG